MKYYFAFVASSWLFFFIGSDNACVSAFLPATTTQTRRGHLPSVLHNSLNAVEINHQLQKNLEKMKERDRAAKVVTKEELKVAYEDEHIIVVDKPSGVLCVSNDDDIPSLHKTVYDAQENAKIKMSQMVVHRLGMDTSGLIVFCKSMKAVKGMNALFRNRQVSKQYEALVCGHLAEDEGLISMPLMRDFEMPPYMRVSTDALQLAISTVDDPDALPKNILDPPKPCLTKYAVVAREEIEGLDVTRVSLSSVTGRTHQLNVHLAAFGHPIVADSVYGWKGEALPNGGVEEDDLIKNFPNRASPELQQQLSDATKDWNMCVHATLLEFKHPVTKTALSLRSPAAF